VSVTASDTAPIVATTVSLALAVAASDNAGAAFAITLAASVALDDVSDAVIASIDHSTVVATGAVLVSASNTISITSTPIGVARGVAASPTGGVAGAVALAGSAGTAHVKTTVLATIAGSTVSGTSAQVKATDHATLVVTPVAASLSVSVGNGAV